MWISNERGRKYTHVKRGGITTVVVRKKTPVRVQSERKSSQKDHEQPIRPRKPKEKTNPNTNTILSLNIIFPASSPALSINLLPPTPHPPHLLLPPNSPRRNAPSPPPNRPTPGQRLESQDIAF